MLLVVSIVHDLGIEGRDSLGRGTVFWMWISGLDEKAEQYNRWTGEGNALIERPSLFEYLNLLGPHLWDERMVDDRHWSHITNVAPVAFPKFLS